MVEDKPPLVDPLNAFCKDTEAYLIGNPWTTLRAYFRCQRHFRHRRPYHRGRQP
ncbi:MAG: hypothetical protein CM1200mP27_10030 [Chloroflexota bacterium]|nr:MAG: hypothetical protein CM1200mP27_10030 [Chloroflexota bacterium]